MLFRSTGIVSALFVLGASLAVAEEPWIIVDDQDALGRDVLLADQSRHCSCQLLNTQWFEEIVVGTERNREVFITQF